MENRQARGFLREADKKEAQGEAFAGPSKLAGETYQSLFEQVRSDAMTTTTRCFALVIS